MSHSLSIPIGVVLERRKLDSPWQDYLWRAISVVPGQIPGGEWKELVRGDDWIQYHVGTTPLELHRKETVGYQHNLESGQPVLYVVLRRTDDNERPVKVQLVTASPYESDAYSESGEESIEPVPMPPSIAELVAAFFDEHHEEQKFYKRQRDKVKIEDHKFGQEPIVETRRRMERKDHG